MLDLMMQRRKYAVKTAQSGTEALELAPDFAPHVVISDIGMPGMDGYQLMSNLRAAPDLAPFKSIALTGYDIQTEDSRARDAGYDAHLTKPIEFDKLFEMIEELVQDIDKTA
jgi:CheY-like chemotaxis protein